MKSTDSVSPSGDTGPFGQVVLKVHSLCDLSCAHCYMYEVADQNWRIQPRAISGEAFAQAGPRAAEHAVARSLPEVQVVLHGGELLLAGRDRQRAIITGPRQARHGAYRLDSRIHANRVRHSARLCKPFTGLQVKTDISADGDRAADDRHSQCADGCSCNKVIQAMARNTGRFRGPFGLSGIIDLANDPQVVYESLTASRPSQTDCLLPDTTWDHEFRARRGRSMVRGLADGRLSPVDRRPEPSGNLSLRFDHLHLVRRDNLTVALGLGPIGIVLIETDGSHEQVDSLKFVYDGLDASGMNVFSHNLDMIARDDHDPYCSGTAGIY